MYRNMETIFTCPHCNEPYARPSRSDGTWTDIEIKPGATYRCSECNKQVVFEVFTPKQHLERNKPDHTD